MWAARTPFSGLSSHSSRRDDGGSDAVEQPASGDAATVTAEVADPLPWRLDPMLLRDRRDAAHRLATRLQHHAGRSPLVLAIPRGAVPMGRIMADGLGGELDVVLVSKLGAPGDPECAIGSIDENGEVILDEDARRIGYTAAWLEQERARRLESLQRRARLYRGDRAPPDPSERHVIVVDDGAATGATLNGALWILRARRPASLTVAVAVSPRRVARRLERVADEVICLYRPWLFISVNQVFRRFEAVDDDTVIACLQGRA